MREGALVENGIDPEDDGPPQSTATASSSALPLVRRAYPRLAKDLLRPLLAIMAGARAMCGGDAQKSEILLLIAMRSIEHPDFAKMSYEEIASGSGPGYHSLGTNIRSIADSADMPRETVRRKVAELTAAGLVTRKGNALSITPAASLAMGRLREAMLRLAILNYELVGGLVKPAQGERPDASSPKP